MKVEQRISEDTQEKKRLFGYIVALTMDSAVYSIVFIKIQRFTLAYLKKKYPRLKSLEIIDKKPKYKNGIAKIEIFISGGLTPTVLHYLLKDEILRGM